jgi:type IV secretion system protein VirD4
MPANSLFRGSALKLAGVLVIVLVASQYFAGFGFLWRIHGDIRDASPLTIARYAYYYGDDPDLREDLLRCSLLGLLIMSSLALGTLWPKPRKLHGDAGYESRSRIQSAGLLGDQGIVLGKLGGRVLLLPGQQGVALAAPPRAGKGTGVVIPNALNWDGSLVCIDLKRENWTVTAGYRHACGQQCYLFEPFADDARTHRWNPFHYVAPDPARRVNDLQRIASMLYPDPAGDTFWMASARSLFLGIALYVFETANMPKTIGEVLRQGMASDDEGFAEHWKRLIAGRMSGSQSLSAECVRSLCDVIDQAPQTASSIRKTFTSRLDLWLNPILDAATSGNDFDLRELRKSPMSIYVGVNPEDLHRLRPVLNLFFQQAIGLQTRELPEHNPALKYQVMMLLDEFTALGRIPIIAESISYLPGYNVRVVLVIQTPAQLREVYGQYNADTMLKSLAARIVFTPKDHGDAQDISNELGNQTVTVKTVSKPQWTLGQSGGRGRSVSESEQRRALMLPQEIKELPSHEALIFYEGLRPIRCQKIRYFADPKFKKRLRPPLPRPPTLVLAQLTLPRSSARGVKRFAKPAASADGGSLQIVEREATSADIAQLRSIEADDVVIDPNLDLFAGLEGAPLQTEAGMNVAINRYMGGVVYARAEVL